MEMKKLIKLFFILTLLNCSGKKSIYDDKGNLYAVAEINNGSTNGKYIIYYPSGKIKCIKYLKNDTVNGKSLYYYENGVLESELHHDMKKLHGDITFYDQNGKIKQVDTYNQDTLLIRKKYNQDGILIFNDLMMRLIREYRKFKLGEKIEFKIEFKNYLFDKREVIVGDGYFKDNTVFITDTLVKFYTQTNEGFFYITAKNRGKQKIYVNYQDISTDRKRFGEGWYIAEYFVE